MVFANELLKKKTKEEAFQKIKSIAYYQYFRTETIEKFQRILSGKILGVDLDEINSDSYIVHTLESALWVFFHTYNFNSAIIGAINLGNATDTIGACVGGLAGIFYTLKDINSHWEKDLIKYDMIKEMCIKFDEACNV